MCFLQAYASISFSSSQVHSFSASILRRTSSSEGSAGKMPHGYCVQCPQCSSPFSSTHARTLQVGSNNTAPPLSQRHPSQITCPGSGEYPAHIFRHAAQTASRRSCFSTFGRQIRQRSHRIPQRENTFYFSSSSSALSTLPCAS